MSSNIEKLPERITIQVGYELAIETEKLRKHLSGWVKGSKGAQLWELIFTEEGLRSVISTPSEWIDTVDRDEGFRKRSTLPNGKTIRVLDGSGNELKGVWEDETPFYQKEAGPTHRLTVSFPIDVREGVY